MHFRWLKEAGLTSRKFNLTLHGMKSNTWFGEVIGILELALNIRTSKIDLEQS